MKQMLLLALAAGLFGCDSTYVEDNMDAFDLRLDIFPTIERENELNDPYVEGSRVEFRVIGADDTQGWSIASSDPAVIRVIAFDPSRNMGIVLAEGEGSAALTISDEDGDQVEQFTVRVGRVAEARITANAILETVSDPPSLGLDAMVNILEGGTATYRARFYAVDGTELRGRDVLSVSDGSDTLMTSFTSFSTWLQVTPTWQGVQDVTLMVDGRDVGQLSVRSIPEESLDAIAIIGSEAGASERDIIVLRAVGVSADAPMVFGVEPDWTANGFALGRGDLYTYGYRADMEEVVSAQFGEGLSAELTVHGSFGQVSSSNTVCSVGWSGGTSSGLAAVAFLILVALRRKRRARRHETFSFIGGLLEE